MARLSAPWTAPQAPRSAEETAAFGAALTCMALLYASLATAVVQVKSMPPRPAWMDGLVIALTATEEEVAASFAAYLDAKGGRLAPIWENHSQLLGST